MPTRIPSSQKAPWARAYAVSRGQCMLLRPSTACYAFHNHVGDVWNLAGSLLVAPSTILYFPENRDPPKNLADESNHPSQSWRIGVRATYDFPPGPCRQARTQNRKSTSGPAARISPCKKEQQRQRWNLRPPTQRYQVDPDWCHPSSRGRHQTGPTQTAPTNY